MTVAVIIINARLNSVFATREAAEQHLKHLHEVNGKSIGGRVEEIEVRE
jgi:hypothetical protein